jgi:hypothetical protein
VDRVSSHRVVTRYLESFKYEPKESKKTKVERLMRTIWEATGLSKGMAEDIADAIIRKRDLAALALQKGWPFDDGLLEGPKGSLDLVTINS